MTGDEAVAYAAGYGDASEDYAGRADEREVSGYCQGYADAAGHFAERLKTRFRAGYAQALEDLGTAGRPSLRACGSLRRRPLAGRRPPGRAR